MCRCFAVLCFAKNISLNIIFLVDSILANGYVGIITSNDKGSNTMTPEQLKAMSAYDLAMDVYQKAMYAKNNLGADHLDPADVLAMLQFIIETDQTPTE